MTSPDAADMCSLLASHWSHAPMPASDWLVSDVKGYRLLASAEADIDRHDGNEKRGEEMTG